MGKTIRDQKGNFLPTVIVIFGGTGALAKEKLIPSLFRMYCRGQLPKMLQIVGFAWDEISTKEFQERVEKIIASTRKGTPAERKAFTRLFWYQQGFFEQREGYEKVAALLGKQDDQWKTCSNKLFYLAIPPQHYKVIFKHLKDSGLTEPCSPEEGWTRVLVEKPFGKDFETAQDLDSMLGKLFKEEQVYRIDHYLGKETVQNILAFRFSNPFLESTWNADGIEEIHIRLLEKRGIGDRGLSYDGIGALRDVGQNHLLQLLALFTMDRPAGFVAEEIRKERAKILRALPVLSEQDVREYTKRAQYVGYRKEKNVAVDSDTETYFRIETALNANQWKGVRIVLESGKAVGEDKVDVRVTFRHKLPCVCVDPNLHPVNVLSYHIQPREGVSIRLWVKKPGPEMVVEEKEFSFDYRKAYKEEEFLDAYERLLLNAIQGDQTLFVSTEEILAEWRFVDPILHAWKKGVCELAKDIKRV